MPELEHGENTSYRLLRRIYTIKDRIKKLQDRYDQQPTDSVLDQIFYWEQRRRELQDELDGY